MTTPTEAPEPTRYQITILAALQRRPLFLGLTDEQWAKVDKRRAKNKVARRQRKLNRRTGN